jgi:hypothetical protein
MIKAHNPPAAVTPTLQVPTGQVAPTLRYLKGTTRTDPPFLRTLHTQLPTTVSLYVCLMLPHATLTAAVSLRTC